VTTEAPRRLFDHYLGWHRQDDDPPGTLRGTSPPQAEVLRLLREAPEGSTTIIGYGGAAGGGKSNLLANTPYKLGLEVPGSSLLVTRQAMVHLKATTLIQFDESLDPRCQVRKYDTSPVYRDVRKDSDKAWSRIWFRPMDDWMSLMSTEYNAFFVEEAQETAERAFLALLTRLRHTASRKWAAVLGFNPFPSWPVDWFMHGELPKEIADDPMLQVHYVPSKIRDNPYLRPGYENMLRASLSGDPWMTAVLIDGVAEHVPNAVYGVLNDPDMRRLCQVLNGLPTPDRWSKGSTGWDWGTSKTHMSAGVLLGMDKTGVIWVLDAWESARGSGDELVEVAEGWQNAFFPVVSARYDKSQASLEDDLKRYYSETLPGVRDVEGRIRCGRGVVYTERLRFNWRSEGARKLYTYLTLYHRDDDDKIVEEKDDMVDAFHYALWALEHPEPDYGNMPPPQASEMKYNFGDDLGFGNDNRRREPMNDAMRQSTERVG
jgi:hypothetical protein